MACITGKMPLTRPQREIVQYLRVFCYTVALNLVPGDFKVHWEAKRSPSEAFEVSIAKHILGDGANIDPDQPQTLYF